MKSGNFISLSNLRKIILEIPAGKGLQISKPFALGEGREGEESYTKSGQEISYLDVALMDLMNRYGQINYHLIGNVHECTETLHHPNKFDVLDDSSPVIQLSLLVERARGIRSMDISRGADVFCAAFVDEGDEPFRSTSTIRTLGLCGERNSFGRGLGGPSQLFQTDIHRGTSEVDWTWNQVRVGDFT